MTATFTDRVRRQLRDELLDTAEATVLAGGWQSLRMQAIADQVGISPRPGRTHRLGARGDVRPRRRPVRPRC